MNPGHFGDAELPNHLRPPSHQVLKAVQKANHLIAGIDGLDGRRADDAIDARDRSTACQDANATLFGQACLPLGPIDSL